jgi:aspartyl-tRNA(Asn)/glutamyl-tRNA(Gln) amidotransferase subunit A
MRIGVPMPYFFDSPDLEPEVKAGVLAAIDALQAAGAEVKEVTIPHAEVARWANTVTVGGEGVAYHKEDLQSRWQLYGKFTRIAIARGALYSGPDYVQAQRVRSYFKKAVAAVMADLAVLITPTSLTWAEKTSDVDIAKRLVLPGFTPQWNLIGLPALALPCGFSSTGFPLSMQIVGKPFAEATVLKVGDAYQRTSDWHLKVPPIAAAVAA